jgi:hypothetical protein
MANDVVRLSHQFRLREAGGIHEVLVEICQLTLGVGLRDDQDIVVDRMFDIGDRKVLSHFHILQETIRQFATRTRNTSASRKVAPGTEYYDSKFEIALEAESVVG